MLYPKILDIEKGKRIKNILMLISVAVSVILLTINVCVNFENKWSLVSIVGIIYVWLTTLYALKRNVNIAAHILIQMLAITGLVLAIDNILQQNGWSVKLAIPIIIITANTSLTILTIVSRKKYIKYAIYQLIIFMLSMLQMVIMLVSSEINVLTIIAASIAVFNFILTLILCGKAVIYDIIRRFHI